MATNANPILSLRALASVTLLVVAAVAGSLLTGWTERNTREQIESNEKRQILGLFSEILPPDAYDNDILADTITVGNRDLLGSAGPLRVWRARLGEQALALLLEAVAPNGYGGPIRLLVGIRFDGSLAGVRVLRHNETSGMGDAIEVARSEWIRGFEGLSLTNPPPEEWAVEKDGGRFDSFTGATITPRAVVYAIRDSLIFFNANRETLFAPVGGPET